MNEALLSGDGSKDRAVGCKERNTAHWGEGGPWSVCVKRETLQSR